MIFGVYEENNAVYLGEVVLPETASCLVVSKCRSRCAVAECLPCW